MPNPAECRYSDSHEWFHAVGDTVTIGISQHAIDELTDITYVELKKPGQIVAAGESVGEVESVKTTSDVYSAIAGKIIAVNESAINDPSILNRDPYDNGWLVKIQCSDLSPLKDLMDGKSYQAKYPVG